jgi:hypothetical protein
MIRVGVGQLPILAIGSIWKNGKYIGCSKGFTRDKYGKRKFELSLSDTTMTTIESGENRDGHFLIPPYYYDFNKNSDALKSHCLCIEYKNDPYGIIIPMVELIRFYYAGSTELCRSLFNGQFYLNEEKLFNKQKSYQGSDGEYVLQLRKEYTDDDAWVVARIACDQTAFRGARRIFESMLIMPTQEKAYPKTIPPFTGDTILTVWGKEISSGNKSRFLVLEIISCTGKFPYEQLTLIRDNFGRSPENDSGEWKSSERNDRPDRNREKLGEETIIWDDEEPDVSRGKYTEYLHHSRFAELKGKEIKKPPKKTSDSKYRHKEPSSAATTSLTTPSASPPEILHSTGEPTHEKSETAPSSFATTSAGDEIPKVGREKGLPATFDNFQKGIEALGQREYIQCDYLVIIPSNIDENVSFFPDAHGEPVKWTRTHRGRRRRQVAICRVTLGKNVFYLFEIERMLKKSDKYTTLILYNHDLCVIEDTTLIEVLMYCARHRGAWLDDNELPELKRRKIKHTWNLPEHFAKKVIGIMNSAAMVKNESKTPNPS